MTNKNPYENQDSMDIKDLIEDDEETNKHSIFDEDEEDDEEVEEVREPVYRRVRQELIIGAGALLIFFLVLSIIFLVFGLNKKNDYKTLKNEYDAYVTKATANEKNLNNQIADLKKQIEDLNKKDPVVVDPVNGSNYRITADNGINVRNSVASSEWTDYDKLPDSVKLLCANNNGVVTIEAGKIVTVLETTNSGQDVWGKIADNAWICLKQGGVDFAVKQ